MQIIKDTFNKEIDVSKYLDIFFTSESSKDISNKEVLLFDIETTGLNVKKTKLYLIGATFYEDNAWQSVQYFAESLDEEELLLKEFEKLCQNYKYVVHFNGNHFDIPYINEKCNEHNISQYLNNLISLDIYTLVKEYKSSLSLPNCKQKTIESLLNINRFDKYNGGELIFQYYDYIKTKDDTLHSNLLLHNLEDLKGMLELFDIIYYIHLINFFKSNDFSIKLFEEGCNKNKISFMLTYKTIPKKLIDFINKKNSINLLQYEIKLKSDSSQNTIIVSTHLEYKKMYHFFNDFTNYYYIKNLDMAIHKSVSKYYEKEKRENAKKSNCYISKEGIFIPIFSFLSDGECFKNSYKDTNYYILFIDKYGTNIVNEEELLLAIKNSILNIGK